MIKRSLVLRQDTLNRENIRNRKIIRFLRNVFHISVGQVRYVGWMKLPSPVCQFRARQNRVLYILDVPKDQKDLWKKEWTPLFVDVSERVLVQPLLK